MTRLLFWMLRRRWDLNALDMALVSALMDPGYMWLDHKAKLREIRADVMAAKR